MHLLIHTTSSVVPVALVLIRKHLVLRMLSRGNEFAQALRSSLSGHLGPSAQINSVQTRRIVKARLRKVHFSGGFLGVFEIFSGSPVL